MDEYNAVISKYERLCTDRNDNRFWADNITQASEDITSPIVSQNFYAYLADSSHIFSDDWSESLGDQLKNGLKVDWGGQEFDTHTVQNGNVTYIRMVPEILDASNKGCNGKSMGLISEGISEEKSDPLT